MNPVKDERNYKIYDPRDPEKQNLDPVLAFVPVGTQLRDSFGTGFVVVNSTVETPKRTNCGLGACANNHENCGPRFL